MDHIHYTKEETDRLFGGPLALLYRARSFRAFSDPFVVFERIFGSAAFPTSLLSDDQYSTPNATPNKQKTIGHLPSPHLRFTPDRKHLVIALPHSVCLFDWKIDGGR